MIRKARWHSQRNSGPRSRRKLWLVGFLVFLIIMFQGFAYVDRNLKPPIMNLAKIRVKQVATEAINEAITAQVAQDQDFDKLVNWKMDTSGKVSGFMMNYSEQMKITSNTFKVVQAALNDVNQLSEHIPVGMALGSPVLASFGPGIPVKIEPQGAAKVELTTRQRDAGINMILVEVFINVSVDVAVVIPFDMENEHVKTEIPISYLLVVGDVPMYYYNSKGEPVGGNGGEAPNISIPFGTKGTSTSETNGTDINNTQKSGTSSQQDQNHEINP